MKGFVRYHMLPPWGFESQQLHKQKDHHDDVKLIRLKMVKTSVVTNRCQLHTLFVFKFVRLTIACQNFKCKLDYNLWKVRTKTVIATFFFFIFSSFFGGGNKPIFKVILTLGQFYNETRIQQLNDYNESMVIYLHHKVQLHTNNKRKKEIINF